MLRIELMPWDRAREQASLIRFMVFVEEQGVPREIELDDQDALSVHALAFEDGKAVATGRLLPDGHIGRMAVLKDWRGRGIGGLILNELLNEARRLGYREARLSAQVHALDFYRRHGFVEEGEEYLEAGIRHREMALRLI